MDSRSQAEVQLASGPNSERPRQALPFRTAVPSSVRGRNFVLGARRECGPKIVFFLEHLHPLGKVPREVFVLICSSGVAYESEGRGYAFVAEVGETDSLPSSIRASRSLNGNAPQERVDSVDVAVVLLESSRSDQQPDCERPVSLRRAKQLQSERLTHSFPSRNGGGDRSEKDSFRHSKSRRFEPSLQTGP